jgi:hypothetical protein
VAIGAKFGLKYDGSISATAIGKRIKIIDIRTTPNQIKW